MQPIDWALLPFSRFFDFSGRSSRAEYWYYTAFIWFVTLTILLMQQMLGEAVEGVLTLVNGLFGLVTFIPSLAVAVRRLHDINRSGLVLVKYIFAWAIIAVLLQVAILTSPIFAGLMILALLAVSLKYLMMMVTAGDPGPNPYGPNPYGLNYGY